MDGYNKDQKKRLTRSNTRMTKDKMTSRSDPIMGHPWGNTSCVRLEYVAEQL